MTTIRGVARLALVVLALVAACGDNDHPGGEQLLVTPQTGLVTTEAGGAATFTVALTNVPLATRMITLTSSNPAEGTVSPQKLEFTKHNWKDPQTVTITGVDDHVVDGNQPYTIAVTGDADSSITEVDVSVTNQDDDSAGFLITPSSGLVTTKTGGTATFTVQLTAQPTDTVTLPLASSNLMEGTIDQSSLTFAPDAWNAPQTVTITGVDDGLPDGNVQYMIITGAATSADTTWNSVNPDDVFVTNLGHALTAIEVTPVDPVIALGTGQQFVATALLDDSTTLDVTQAVTWSSSNGPVATISNTAGTVGFATSHDIGTSTIQADWLGQSGSTLLTVTHATLASIQVTPANPSIAKGTFQPFAATGVYTDSSTQDLTNQVVWSSSDLTVGTISNNAGSQGLAHGTGTGTTTIQAALGSVTGSTLLTVTAASLVSIDVTPSNPSVAKGTGQQFTATGHYTDGTTQPLTSSVTWASSDTSTATISNAPGTKGLASTLAVGSSTISATQNGVVGSTLLTVTAATLASIEVTPTNPSTTKGATVQLTATGIYTDNSTQDLTTQVTWASSLTTVATISNASGSQGLATAQAVGQTTISATFGGKTGSTILTVKPATLASLQVTPTTPSAAKGTTVQFTAIATFSDNTTQDVTTQATWASSNGATATISNAAGSQGLATATGVGTTTISATFGGLFASTVLTVTAATVVSVEVTPANPSIAKGTTLQFTATAIYSDSSTQDVTLSATWSSSNTTVATIGNAPGNRGRATGNTVGTSTITATFNGTSGSTLLTVTPAVLAQIQVTPANSSAPKGTTVQFTATGIYSDGTRQDLTTQATWFSSNTVTATISNAAGSQGLASALAVGSSNIRATFGGITGVTGLTVTAATLASISVTPTNPSIAKGTQLQFTASGLYTDGTSQDLTAQATWASTNSLIADVGATTGLAHGDSTGSVTISATFGGKTGSTILTVTPATLVSITVLPTDPSVAKGSDLQFTALGTYTDSTTQDLTAQATWTSQLSPVATISNASGSQGLAHAAGPGVSTISATFGGKTGSTNLTVTAATLASIQVTPSSPSIAKGTDVQFTATGVFTDGTTQDLTTTATWSSATGTVATISNVAGSQGLAHAAGTGSTTISATVGSISGSTLLTVTAATLTAIQVTPSDPSIAKGTTLQLTATALYSDGSIQDVTTQAAWSSSVPGTATVSTAAGSQGLATAVAAGTTSIKATFGGTSGSTTLTVTAATLVSVSISPTTPSIANGTTQQFTLTGLYSDSTTQDMTASAFWASSVTTVATISTGPISFGLATGTGPGTTTISATVGGLSDSTTLTVNGVLLTGVVVTPVNPTLAKGASAQFTCTGVYRENSTQDLTATALWATTNANAASVSNAAGSQGLVTAVDIGSADISCRVGAFTDTSTVTVTSATITSIDVSPTTPTIAAGVQLQFTATVHYSNGVVQDISDSATWTSSNTNAATISNQTGFEGLASTIAAGTTTITASFGGSSGTATLTVTSATCVSIAITPVNPKMAKQTQLQFLATGTFSDGTQADITSVATWTSSNTNAATISNQTGLQGNATGVAAGTTTISATFEGKVGSTTLTVTNAVLVSITLSPANPTVPAGTQVKFTATGHFSDGTTQDLTIQCSWSSTNKFVAKTTMARKRRGLVTTISAGTATINATTLGVTGSTTITVQ